MFRALKNLSLARNRGIAREVIHACHRALPNTAIRENDAR
jgi:hypothetical protein